MPKGQRLNLPAVPLPTHANLRVSQSVIYTLIAQGDLPAVHIGRLIRIPRQAFLTWLDTTPPSLGHSP